MASPAPSLPSKLTRPRLKARVPRERLFARLDALHEMRVVWVAGPPGAGKTTLVADWLDTRRKPSLWVQLDGGDADPASFFYYLRQAAVHAGAPDDASLPLLTAEYQRDLDGFARRWFRALYIHLGDDLRLVLDNVQEVTDSSPLHRTLAAAAEEIPSPGQLIAASRSAPPAAFARLAASDELAGIDWEQLKLTADETAALLALRGVAPTAQLDELHSLCGGWAAGVRLVGERLRVAGRVDDLGAPGTRDDVFDYFASQIFDGIAPEAQAALMRLAFLPRMSAAMAQQLSGFDAAGGLLDYLNERALFTDRRPGTPPSYQFHALFRAFLTSRARQQLGVDACRDLTHRAAQLLEQAGLLDEAVTSYLDVAAYSSALRAILVGAEALARSGRWQTLRGWVERLPVDVVASEPWLAYWIGVSLLGVDLRDARAASERAYTGFEAQGDRAGQLMSVAAILETHFLELDDARPTRMWLDKLGPLLDKPPVMPNAEAAAQVYGALTIVMFWCDPPNPRLHHCAQRLIDLVSESLAPDVRVGMASYAAEYLVHTFQLSRLQTLSDRIEPLLAGNLVPPLARAQWMLRKSWYAALRGDWTDEHRLLTGALRIAQDNGFHFLLTLIWGNLGDSASTRGDLASTRDAAERMRQALPTQASQSSGRYFLLLSRLASASGDWAEARRQAQAAYTIASRGGWPLVELYYGVELIAVLTEIGEYATAQSVLDDIRGAHPEPNGAIVRATIMAECTLRARRGDDPRTWLDALREVLAARATSGILAYGRSRLLTRQMCELALAEGVQVDYMASIVRLLGLSPSRPGIPNWPGDVAAPATGDEALARRLVERVEELARARDAAEQANLAKTRLLAAASHDLRQPMQAIGLLVGALRQRVGEADARELVDKIDGSVEALEGLFDALLDVSRLDSGAIVAQRRELALADLLARLELGFAPTARDKGLRLSVRPSHARVDSDPVLLERILRNLVSNAIRYTERGGVVVGTRRRGQTIWIEVWDTGAGIPVDKKARVFDEFVQLGTATRDGGKGLGLGLAIVRRLAGLLDHRITLRSRPGRGSVFAVELPWRGVQVPLPQGPGGRAAELRGSFVVVIDDDAGIRDSMRSLLVGLGCRVLTADSGSEAVAALAEHLRAPDLIVSDYRLAGAHAGTDAIRMVREALEATIPALLITGESSTRELAELRSAGWPVLQKPVNVGRLREAIAGAIGLPMRASDE